MIKSTAMSILLVLIMLDALWGCSKAPQCVPCQACPVVITTKDAAITSAVQQSLLKNNPTIAPDIQVQTKNGVVVLSGFVKNQEEADAAIKTAQAIPGVKVVHTSFVRFKPKNR